MDALRTYNRATSALLASQAFPLLLSPSMIIWLLSTDPRTVSAQETFFARSLGISMLVLAFLNLLLTGEIDAILASDGSIQQSGQSQTELKDIPHALPTVYATMIYHAVSGVLLYSYSYSQALSGGLLTVAAVLEVVLAGAAVLLVMFGQGPGHISRRTGADKRTSGFPFKNAEADKRKVR